MRASGGNWSFLAILLATIFGKTCAYVLQNPPLDDASSEQDPTALRLGMGGIGLGVLVIIIFTVLEKVMGIDPPEDVTELDDGRQESPAVAFEMYNRYYHRDALKRNYIHQSVQAYGYSRQTGHQQMWMHQSKNRHLADASID